MTREFTKKDIHTRPTGIYVRPEFGKLMYKLGGILVVEDVNHSSATYFYHLGPCNLSVSYSKLKVLTKPPEDDIVLVSIAGREENIRELERILKEANTTFTQIQPE